MNQDQCKRSSNHWLWKMSWTSTELRVNFDRTGSLECLLSLKFTKTVSTNVMMPTHQLVMASPYRMTAYQCSYYIAYPIRETTYPGSSTEHAAYIRSHWVRGRRLSASFNKDWLRVGTRHLSVLVCWWINAWLMIPKCMNSWPLYFGGISWCCCSDVNTRVKSLWNNAQCTWAAVRWWPWWQDT